MRAPVLIYLVSILMACSAKVAAASMLLLDRVIGEYDVETKIGGIDVQPLPDSPARAGLKPLTDLPPVVDRWAP